MYPANSTSQMSEFSRSAPETLLEVPLGRHSPAASYVGFDFYPGENVDVVGDAHKLSSYFGHDEKFDLIFSSAVFEHLHMPWIVAQEIQKS